MKLVWILFLSVGALHAQANPARRDACAAPPGSNAPALPAKLLPGQGDLHFPITTRSAEAQRFFNQGIAQMHSFWATEAERSFLQAAALDPEAPMPYWGIAMVAAGDYRPRFQLEGGTPPRRNRTPQGAEARAVAAARKAVELSAVPGRASELEKLYIAAAAARRNLNAKDPDADYIAALRALLARYPQEVEARSYLALHLMRGFVLPAKTPREGSMEAAAILRGLLRDAPDHPGVHHYVIHGFEGSTFAKDAWPSCRRYPELAPNIPHALHMPGHIWAQTGRWQDAVASFEAAKENELGWIRADRLFGTGHHGHNVHFLAASYSFAGQYEQALAAARGLLEFAENPREAQQVDNFRTAYRQGWFALMRTLVQFEKWEELLDGRTLPVYDKPRERAWRHWAQALAYAARNNLPAARREAQAMRTALKDLQNAVKTVPESLRVARSELDGHLALAAGRNERGLRKLAEAMRQEQALRYNEPPSYPRPVAEALGRRALALGRTALAEDAFRQALDQYPEDAHARQGLQAAARSVRAPAAGGF
jgi:tetratricopeptide (TPR) repeat protein